MQVRTTYLTIRCPKGCEAWLHARASVPHHVDRCRGRPWVDDIAEVAVVPSEYSSLVEAAVDPALLGLVSMPGETRADPADGRCKRPVPLPAGTLTVRTPIAGVHPRRWLTVALAVWERHGSDGVERSCDPDAFRQFEAEVLNSGVHVDCPSCRALVTTRGLKHHQATNASCMWRRAASEVRTAWEEGWRDPYSIDDAPLTWRELTGRVCWRHRLRTVVFPRWVCRRP